MSFSLSVFAPENLVSRDGFGSPVPRQAANHLILQMLRRSRCIQIFFFNYIPIIIVGVGKNGHIKVGPMVKPSKGSTPHCHWN